jgi:membrane protein required for colicin V production
MAIIDVIILIPILLGILKGYKKGLMIEVFTLAALGVSILLGFKLLGITSGFLNSFLGDKGLHFLSPYLSFLSIFIPSFFLLKKAGWLMKKAIRLTFLGTFDGALGALLGAFTVLFSLSIVFWLLDHMGITIPKTWLNNPILYDFTKNFGPNLISKILNIIPFGDNWIEKIENLKSKLPI